MDQEQRDGSADELRRLVVSEATVGTTETSAEGRRFYQHIMAMLSDYSNRVDPIELLSMMAHCTGVVKAAVIYTNSRVPVTTPVAIDQSILANIELGRASMDMEMLMKGLKT